LDFAFIRRTAIMSRRGREPFFNPPDLRAQRNMKPEERIDPLIVSLRRQKVILDADLAELYGVPTKVLNQAVKRNGDRFPLDFMFQLTAKEWSNLKARKAASSSEVTQPESVAPNWSQIVTSSRRNRGGEVQVQVQVYVQGTAAGAPWPAHSAYSETVPAMPMQRVIRAVQPV
jgi:hypothetical protein